MRKRSWFREYRLWFLFMVLLVPLYAPAQPRLQVESEELNLGTVFNGSSKTVSFAIKNAGNQDLQILSVRTSCGCTAVKEPRKLLKPGESDEIEVAFTATGFRGTVQKYINIESNDPDARFVSVTLTANVREDLAPRTLSSLVWLGSVPVGKEIRQDVVFRNELDQVIAIRQITTSADHLRATARKKTVAPGDSIVVELTVVPQKDGYFGGEFVLQTSSRNQPTVSMKVAYIGVRP
jgi:hypothetical protein